MFDAKIVDNFITEESSDYLVHFAKHADLWVDGGSDFWSNRITNYYDVQKMDWNASLIMIDANQRCGEEIKKQYGINEPIYSDTLQIVRWFPGMEQPPHVDDMSDTDVTGFEHRAFGSIIYLNDDYVGGHTYYPNDNFEVIPQKGRLAIHRGDKDHLHGVTKIEDNIRYTLVSFWTFDKDKSHDWPIP